MDSKSGGEVPKTSYPAIPSQCPSLVSELINWNNLSLDLSPIQHLLSDEEVAAINDIVIGVLKMRISWFGLWKNLGSTQSDRVTT